jgi:hypothetical protein
MDAVGFLAKLLPVYQTKRRHTPEDHSLNIHRRDKFRYVLLHCVLFTYFIKRYL